MTQAARSDPGAPDAGSEGARPEISVVIPFFNEEENVAPLLEELYEALGRLGRSFEVVGVDDGSTDATFERLRSFAARERTLRCLRFRRNFGQTAAMSAGIDLARGDVIVPMDGDLQNDPADIGRLLDVLEGSPGYDVVSGWRKVRRDHERGRKLPSQIANRLISAISGVILHDYGCTLKAYRREVLVDVRLYGEMHRFIPIYTSWQGARVTEMVVNHRPRRSGRSNYGLDRTGKVILDLMVVLFLGGYRAKPMYVFGGFGLLSLLASFTAFAVAVGLKLAHVRDFVTTPLPLLGVLFALGGLVGLLMGLLAELVVRTYYEAQGRRPYVVAEALNVPSSGGGRGRRDAPG